MEDGGPDHDRFGHTDEQGIRGDRSRWLFDFAPTQVEVVVHPQSSVHAMVEYKDGSVIAQISATDMRMPIQYALTWPERAAAPVPRSTGRKRGVGVLAPDFDKFPLLRLAYECHGSRGFGDLHVERGG